MNLKNKTISVNQTRVHCTLTKNGGGWIAKAEGFQGYTWAGTTKQALQGLEDKLNSQVKIPVSGGKIKVDTIDMTPTWEDVILIHAQAAANGSKSAMDELRRCTRIADKAIAVAKDSKAQEVKENKNKFVDFDTLFTDDNLAGNIGKEMVKDYNLRSYAEAHGFGPDGITKKTWCLNGLARNIARFFLANK